MTDESNPGPNMGSIDMSSLLGQARQIQERMQKAQEAIANIKVEGNAGGGMVLVEANGKGTVLRVSIESVLFESGDKEMAEDLVAAAVNQALTKARQVEKEEMASVTGGLPIPPGLANLF